MNIKNYYLYENKNMYLQEKITIDKTRDSLHNEIGKMCGVYLLQSHELS